MAPRPAGAWPRYGTVWYVGGGGGPELSRRATFSLPRGAAGNLHQTAAFELFSPEPAIRPDSVPQ